MENCSSRRINNLEEYLQDIFKKECVFKIEEEEVEFIQRGIETLVLRYIDQWLTRAGVANWLEDTFRELQSISNESLENVYFPSKWASRFQGYAHIKAESISLLKVGSFYEGTRNGFPDEYDLIFILACMNDTSPHLKGDLMCTSQMHLLHELDYLYDFEMSSLISDGRRKISFSKFVEEHGPAAKLLFIYNNGDIDRDIHVDLVTAVQCSAALNNDRYDYRDYLKICVGLKSFHDQVRAAKTFLLVFDKISFTDTEVDFIKNVLFEKHKKVHRILKYLINGHGDGEKLKEMYKVVTGYTSYKIKVMIIYHHDVCTNTDSEDLGPCVIQVLEELCRYTDTSSFPLFWEFDLYDNFSLIPYIKSLIKILKCLQTSADNYDYETKRFKSVSGQFLHDKDLSESGQTASEEFIEARRLILP